MIDSKKNIVLSLQDCSIGTIDGMAIILLHSVQTKKEEYFGSIESGSMILSSIGVIANVLWYEIKNHFNNVELDAFMIIPNHLHRIIILSNNGNSLRYNRQLYSNVHMDTIEQQRFQNQGKNSIFSIVGACKSAVSKHSHRLGFNFSWQGRFYDNITRNEKSYRKIIEYIESNPAKWEEDRFYSVQR